MRLLRRVLGVLLAAVTLCSAPAVLAEDRDPLMPRLEFVFEEVVTLGGGLNPGTTPIGERYIIPITGGSFEGPGDGSGFKGVIMPGGWDWQLKRSDGCVWAYADYMLKTDDGVIINVRNQGPMCPQKEGAAPVPILLTPIFEAPLGRYQWLNQAAFVNRLDIVTHEGRPAVRIRFYRVR